MEELHYGRSFPRYLGEDMEELQWVTLKGGIFTLETLTGVPCHILPSHWFGKDSFGSLSYPGPWQNRPVGFGSGNQTILVRQYPLTLKNIVFFWLDPLSLPGHLNFFLVLVEDSIPWRFFLLLYIFLSLLHFLFIAFYMQHLKVCISNNTIVRQSQLYMLWGLLRLKEWMEWIKWINWV